MEEPSKENSMFPKKMFKLKEPPKEPKKKPLKKLPKKTLKLKEMPKKLTPKQP